MLRNGVGGVVADIGDNDSTRVCIGEIYEIRSGAGHGDQL